MNLRRFGIIATIIIATVSCKKDDDGEIAPSLDGYLLIEGLPEFVEYGQQIAPLKVKGASHPDGGDIEYSWTVTPSYPQAHTGSTYTYKPTDTLQTCTVTCTASAEGYSSISTSSYTTVVKGGKNGSVKGISFPDEPISGSDKYYEIQIGTQTWLMNNLTEATGECMPYKGYEIMSDVLGMYYNQDDAIAACQTLPGDNWVLPSVSDWDILETFIMGEIASSKVKSAAAYLMADATFNGDTMWKYRPDVGDIPQTSTFSAIPAGYANLDAGTFHDIKKYATFWTSDKNTTDSSLGVCKYIYWDKPEIFESDVDARSFGATVRCIRK